MQTKFIKITVFDQSTKKARLFSIPNTLKLSQLRQLIEKQWQIKEFKFINQGVPCSKPSQKHTPVTMYLKTYYLITIMTPLRQEPKKQSKIIEKQTKKLTQPSSMAQRHIANTRQFLEKEKIHLQKQKLYEKKIAFLNKSVSQKEILSIFSNHDIIDQTNQLVCNKDNQNNLSHHQNSNNFLSSHQEDASYLVCNEDINGVPISIHKKIHKSHIEDFFEDFTVESSMNQFQQLNTPQDKITDRKNRFKFTRQNIEYCQLKYGIQLSENGQGLDFDYMPVNLSSLTKSNNFSVEWLGLYHCQITDQGWKTLVANANNFPNLKILGLKNNQITTVNEGDLQQFKSLRLIQFGSRDGQNPLTEDSKTYLKKFKQQNKRIRVKFRN